MFNNKINFK